MKISQRDLEFKVLKCITTYDTALDMATEKSLKEYYFLSKEPGIEVSLTGKIFKLCEEYYKDSGGYKLTEGLKAPSGNPMVVGILATAEVKNGNGRYYPREIWEKEIDKYNQVIEENRSTGELDHPDSTIISLKNKYIAFNLSSRELVLGSRTFLHFSGIRLNLILILPFTLLIASSTSVR